MVQDKDKEMMGNYWNLHPGHKQLRWFTKEVYLQKAMKIRTQDQISMKKLKTEVRGDKMITNIINYDILANPWYNDKLYYSVMDERIQMETSDFVARALYFGEECLDES